MSTTYAIREMSLGLRDACSDKTEIRQLRHHTKNTLQRIIGQLAEASAQCKCREGRRLAEDLAHQIRLSAEISDALFGLTHTPEPIVERLRSLAENLIALYTDGEQTIQLKVTASPGLTMSHSREESVLRLVHELAMNALKHGMHMRLVGKLSIQLSRRGNGELVLSVANDGWRMDEMALPGEGLGIVRELVRVENGRTTIATQPHTNFQISLPPEGGAMRNLR